MKNYIRTCLSLDQETRDKAIDLAMILGTTMSDTIREAVKYLYNHVASWKAKEEK